MAVKYEELEDRNGTVYNKITGQGYKDPTALANDLGTTSDKINWGSIAKSVGNTAGANATASVKTTPSPVVTSTQARKNETENAKNYIQFSGSSDVYNKATKQYVPYEEAVQKNIWNDIQVSNEAKTSEYSNPIQSIQQVFGANWKPSVSQEVQAKGVYGAVSIGNQVYTLGPGGGPVNSDQFKQLFGTDDQTGIVGKIDLEQATKLGITPTQDDISSFNSKMTEDMYKVTSLGDVATKAEDITKKAYAEADKTQTEIKDAYTKVISTIKNFSTEKADAKAKESEKLGLEEKSKAISDAQTTYSKVKASYDSYIQGLLSKGGLTTADIGNMTAQAKSQQAVQLAPLESAISIAQDNYDRAKTQLDDWSEEYNTNFEMLLSAYQSNIDMLGEELTYEQSKAKTEAEQKLALLTQSYTEMKSTQEEVKKLALLYPESGITVSDSWDSAYKKASPYIKSEQDLEKKATELDLKLKEAQIGATNRSNRGSGSTYSSGVDGITSASQMTRFQSALSKGLTRLQSGESWGTVWNSVKSQFPNVPDDVIDASLGGSVETYVEGPTGKIKTKGSGWAAEGAYEDYKAKQNATKTTTMTESKRKVVGAVNILKQKGASQDEINTVITGSGYELNDPDFQ